MGTDIDLYVERREHGRWSLVFPPEEMLARLHHRPPPPSLSGGAWYSDRNYGLFALLADVRNYNDIVSPWAHRGLPESFTLPPDLTRGHSHSWATLAELQAYDWEGTRMEISGLMDPAEYRHFRDTGTPVSYSRGVGGPKTVVVSPEEMDEMFASGKLAATTTWHDREATTLYYSRVSWTETMAEAAGRFLAKTLPAIAEVTAGTLPEDVRLVYWFDC